MCGLAPHILVEDWTLSREAKGLLAYTVPLLPLSVPGGREGCFRGLFREFLFYGTAHLCPPPPRCHFCSVVVGTPAMAHSCVFGRPPTYFLEGMRRHFSWRRGRKCFPEGSDAFIRVLQVENSRWEVMLGKGETLTASLASQRCLHGCLPSHWHTVGLIMT